MSSLYENSLRRSTRLAAGARKKKSRACSKKKKSSCNKSTRCKYSKNKKGKTAKSRKKKSCHRKKSKRHGNSKKRSKRSKRRKLSAGGKSSGVKPDYNKFIYYVKGRDIWQAPRKTVKGKKKVVVKNAISERK